MIRFDGFDEKGNVMTSPCNSHLYSTLPNKGLGRSMEGVGLNEPVIIPKSAAIEGVTWGYTEAEIYRRQHELQAEINWMELPLFGTDEEPKIQMWFSPKCDLTADGTPMK